MNTVAGMIANTRKVESKVDQRERLVFSFQPYRYARLELEHEYPAEGIPVPHPVADPLQASKGSIERILFFDGRSAALWKSSPLPG
jgi:hypothetical protein